MDDPSSEVGNNRGTYVPMWRKTGDSRSMQNIWKLEENSVSETARKLVVHGTVP